MINKIKTTFRDKSTKKLHKKGDTYKHEDAERVAFLLENGYLEESKMKKETKKKSGE